MLSWAKIETSHLNVNHVRDNTLDQPPHDYVSFDPDDWISVFWHAYAVYRCINDVRKKARKDKRDLPPIETLPQAIRGCSRRLLMEYLED